MKHRYLKVGNWYIFYIILQFGVFLLVPNLNFWPSSPHRCSTQVAVARLRVTFPIFIGVVICSELLEGQNAWLTESCTSWYVRGCRVLYIKWKSATEFLVQLKNANVSNGRATPQTKSNWYEELNWEKSTYYHSIKSYWSISGFRFSSNGTQTFPTSPWWLRDLARDDGKYSPAGSAPSKKETSS